MEHKKHREIKTLKIYEEGGLVIIFTDETHTYIQPEFMNEIIEKYKKIIQK